MASDKLTTDYHNPEMFAPQPVARTVQVSRDAQGRGLLMSSKPQQKCDVGLFETAPDQLDIFS